jgi:HK97 family phage prohead protease
MVPMKILVSKAQPRIWTRTGNGLVPSSNGGTRISKSAPTPASPKSSLIDQTVFFRIKGSEQEIAGVVKSIEGGMATVMLCLPNTDGVLFLSKDSAITVPVHDLQVVGAETVVDRLVKSYSENVLVEVNKDKSATEVKDSSGNVVDYRGVKFDGLASTFQSVTPKDRDGDYILPTAFNKWLPEFKRNPVLLTDHRRSVMNLMGHYEKVSIINDKGLAVTGAVTDSPHEDAKHVRFSLVEGSLKTLSIGGSFFYLQDMKGIEEIRLHEISLVVVPANPDAVVVTRSLTTDHVLKAFKFHCDHNGGELRSGVKMKT